MRPPKHLQKKKEPLLYIKAVLYIKSKYYLAKTEREKEWGEVVIWDNTEETKETRRSRNR